MKKFTAFVWSLLACVAAFAAGAPENPQADPKAVVTSGNARFTVLTPQLLRMEWSADSVFEDNKTLTFVNRNLPVPHFKVKKSKNGVTITTDSLELTYRNTGRPFDKENLQARFRMNGKWVKWNPEMTDSLNLKGTTRTLDGCNGKKMGREPMEDGLLSRSGWSVVDDSQRHLLVPHSSHWGEWVQTRPEGERRDLYLFAYGHNYLDALADYAKVAGAAPMPPLYTLGYWWSRYWQYSDNELVDLVNKLKAFDIPLDVLIVDMDWHDTWGMRTKNSELDEFGQRKGWTGYTWQKELFPNPQNFLKWVHSKDLKVALNLHPASGIQPYEECFGRFAKAYNWPDSSAVPFHIDEPEWADAYFGAVLEPMERDGIDFWWLDWQQWRESKYTPGLSNTFWLNKTFFDHAANRESGERPFIYHRWGGLGSHRYPLGFSGDTYINWDVLGFLPWFTSTASNVNYGYWGHDIGGHYFGGKVKHVTDPELYLRWLQYGVFTPIFKTHSTKDKDIVRYIWAFPDHVFRMRDAIRLRYALVPYIYNAARQNFDTGVAMTRPMYYYYPETEIAYNVPQQFFFGDDIIATAVATPVDSLTGLAPRSMWFPAGQWYDFSTGRLFDGDSEHTLYYTLDENPFYVRAGAIIPMNPDRVSNLQNTQKELVLTFIPGADGKLTHYQDDGTSTAYETANATTEISKTTSGNKVEVKIGARRGSYAGAPDAMAYELRFPATFPPVKVVVDGKEYPYARFATPGTWTYDPYSLQPVIYTTALPTGRDVAIEMVLPEGDQATLYGKKGLFGRLNGLTPLYKEEQGRNGENQGMLPVEYLKVSQCPSFLLEDPQNFEKYLTDFDNNRASFLENLDGVPFCGDDFKRTLRAQLNY